MQAMFADNRLGMVLGRRISCIWREGNTGTSTSENAEGKMCTG
jgi:hypothetical protein